MSMAAEATPPTEDPAFAHESVMTAEVIEALAPRAGGIYVDATAGGGGHSAAILEACSSARVLAFDRDPRAVEAAGEYLARFGERASVEQSSFSELPDRLDGLPEIDGLVADLGLSSPQLDDPARGMSFRREGPLDMRMDPTRGETAHELIERLDQDELADVIYQLGEERRSRRVARCIKRALADGALRTTHDLRRAVVHAVGPRRVGGVDPATRTFQALRIAVNHELDELAGLLALAPTRLAVGGVAVFISFHSLEDRLVKRAFLQRDVWKRQSKKPLVAGDDERSRNPRSRSAKLRAAMRLGPDEEASPIPPSGSEPPSDPEPTS